jgi:DNA-binding NarL/FixJ family response regulator
MPELESQPAADPGTPVRRTGPPIDAVGPAASPDREPFRLALIDDTPDVRALLRMAFERTEQFEVVAEAADGQEGVEAARKHQPDVVLLDIAMPVMDGLQALPLVREACPSATVVMLSGFGAEAMSEKVVALGADGYIQKGLSVRSLVAEVQLMAARARAGERPTPT